MENLQKEKPKMFEEKNVELSDDTNLSVMHSESSVPSSKEITTKNSEENKKIQVLEDLEDKIGTTEYDINSWNAGVKNDLLVFSKYLQNTVRIQSFLKCKELQELLDKRAKLQEEMISSKLCYNDCKIHHLKTIKKYKEISKDLKKHSWLNTEKTFIKRTKLNEDVDSHKLQYKLLNEAMKILRKWDKKWVDSLNKCLLSPKTKTIQHLINRWLKYVNKINISLEKEISKSKEKISKQDKETENVQIKIRTLLNPTGLKVKYSVSEENQYLRQVLDEGKFKSCYKDEKCEGNVTKFFKSLVDNKKESEDSDTQFQFSGLKKVGTREKSDLQRDMNNILKVIDELRIEPLPTEKVDIFEIKPEVIPSILTKNEEDDSLHKIDKQEKDIEFLTLINKIDNIEMSFAEIKQKLVYKMDEKCEESENLRHFHYFCDKYKELMKLQESYNCEIYKKVNLLHEENKFLSEGININLDRINYDLGTIKHKLDNLGKIFENLDDENKSTNLEVKNEMGEMKKYAESNTQLISELKNELNVTKINIENKLESMENEFQLMREKQKNQEISESNLIQKELNCLKNSTEKYTCLMNDQLRSIEKTQQSLQESLENDNLKMEISELRQYCERIEGELKSHLGVVEYKGDDLVTSLKLPWDMTAMVSISDTMRSLLSHRATFSQVPNCTILHQLREHQAAKFCKSRQSGQGKIQQGRPYWKP